MIKRNKDIKLKQIVRNHLKHSNSIKLNEKTEKKDKYLLVN